jgi:hypothetical protein
MVRPLLAFRVSFIVIAAVLASQSGAAAPKEVGAKATLGESGSSTKGTKDAPSKPFTSPLPSVLGVGPALFFDDTDRIVERRVNGQRDGQPDRDALVSDGFLALQAWYLFPWWLQRLRVGPGLAWYNAYTLVAPEEEDDDDRYHVGQTFQLFGQAEYVLTDIASVMDLMLGLRAGGIVVVPGQEVQDELDRMESLGFNVWPTPRWGAMISPHVGITWPLNKRLSLRSDIGVQFAKVWLWDVEAEESNILIESNSHLLTTRTQVLLGLEFAL